MMGEHGGIDSEYIITAKNTAGLVSLRRETPAAAIKKAVELMGSGHIEVQITAPDGEIYYHTEFDRLYRKTET